MRSTRSLVIVPWCYLSRWLKQALAVLMFLLIKLLYFPKFSTYLILNQQMVAEDGCWVENCCNLWGISTGKVLRSNFIRKSRWRPPCFVKFLNWFWMKTGVLFGFCINFCVIIDPMCKSDQFQVNSSRNYPVFVEFLRDFGFCVWPWVIYNKVTLWI